MHAGLLAVGLVALSQPFAARRAQIIAETSGWQAGRIEAIASHDLRVLPYNDLSDARDFAIDDARLLVFQGSKELRRESLRPGDDVRIHYETDGNGGLQARAVEPLSRSEAWLARVVARQAPPLLLRNANTPGLPEAQVRADASTVERGVIAQIGAGHLTLHTSRTRAGRVFQFDGARVPVYAGTDVRGWQELTSGCEIRVFACGGSRDMPARVVAIELLGTGESAQSQPDQSVRR